MDDTDTMTQALLATLHQGGAWALYTTLPDARSTWYPTAAPLDVDYAAVQSNLYFAVNPLTQIPQTNARGAPAASMYIRSQTAYIAALNCLFAEFDLKDYGDMASIAAVLARHPAPSATVASGGGLHAYWLLDAPYVLADADGTREAAKWLQAAWVAHVGGDVGAKDITRMLRVPGSTNYKYAPPRPVAFVTADLNQRYALATLAERLPARVAPSVRTEHRRSEAERPIERFNEANAIGDVLSRYGYVWRGRTTMLSPYSSSGSPGVRIDDATNRAFVHHGSDPLGDGYWKRPFDVVCRLDCGGDVRAAIKRITGQA